MSEGRSERVARAEAGALKYWIGVRPTGLWERAGWCFSCALGLFRMVLLVGIATSKSVGFFLLGVGTNVLMSAPLAWLATWVIGGTFNNRFAFLMMTTQFLSLVSMVRADGPDLAAVAFGAVSRKSPASFKARLFDGVKDVAHSALQFTDDYRAAARYWYARRFVFAHLISYVVLCIALLSTFMTFAVAYARGAAGTPLTDWRTMPALFLYYFQLGFDGAFFNLLDLAGIQLSDVRPAEPFALRLIRFSIYTLYLARIVGYASDVIQVSTEDTRQALEQRIQARVQ